MGHNHEVSGNGKVVLQDAGLFLRFWLSTGDRRGCHREINASVAGLALWKDYFGPGIVQVLVGEMEDIAEVDSWMARFACIAIPGEEWILICREPTIGSLSRRISNRGYYRQDLCLTNFGSSLVQRALARPLGRLCATVVHLRPGKRPNSLPGGETRRK